MIIQSRNAEAQMLGSPDHLFARDRNFAFSAYNTSGETYTSTTVLGLNTVTVNHAPEIFQLASNILTVATPGVYLVRIHGVMSMSGGGAGQAVVYLEEDPATASFSTVLSTQTYVYLPASLQGSFECNAIVHAAGFNFRYRIASLRTSGAGNVNTINGTVSLAAVLLYNNE